jgi:hypothetical protein
MDLEAQLLEQSYTQDRRGQFGLSSEYKYFLTISSLPAGAIAGIVIGVVAVIAAATVAFILWRKRKSRGNERDRIDIAYDADEGCYFTVSVLYPN